MQNDLPRLLREWQDFDAVEHDIARVLGLYSQKPEGYLPPKHVYWSANSIGDFVGGVITDRVKLGILEKDEETE